MLISMRRFPARTYAWLRQKLSDLHWYPTAKEMAGVSDERLSSLRQESGASLARIIFLLLSLGAFCLVALQSPDRHLLSPAAEISLPFVGSPVSFLGFVVFGPLLLFGVWGYLHVLTTYHRKLGQELARRALAPIPTISEVSHPLFRLLFYGAYIPFVPFILLWFTYKSMAVPGLGVFALLWTLLVMWSILLAALRWVGSRSMKLTMQGLITVLCLSAGLWAWSEPRQLLRPYNLYRADLSEAFLPKESLRRALLVRADLKGAVLRDGDLQGADLRRADLRQADLTGAKLQNADLRWANLRGTKLESADLRRARLSYVDAQGADLYRADLRETTIRTADLEDANLQRARLDGAEIADSVFKNAQVHGATFKEVSMQALSPRFRITRALGLDEEQRAALWMADKLHASQPVYDGKEGDIIGYEPPPWAFEPWEGLEEPTGSAALDPEGIIALAASESPEPLPVEIEPSDGDWSSGPFEGWAVEPPGPDYGSEANESQEEPGQGRDPWESLLDHASQHRAVVQWLLDVVKDPGEPRKRRREALTVLLNLKDQKEAQFAYEELLGWIAQEDPRTLADAQFQVKVARKYLMLYAIRKESIPAELALKVLKQLYGPGWEQLLKSLPKKEPFFNLSPEEERRWRLTQKGALRLIEN